MIKVADSRYNLPFKRRKEGRTNYKQRLKLAKSGKPRLVTRKTGKQNIVQLVEIEKLGDYIITSANSKALEDYEWKGHQGNLPSAYLTGYLLGKRAINEGAEEAVHDIGLHVPSKGSRIFAMLKGALDAGLEIPHGEQKIPEEERIKGEHIANYASSMEENEKQEKFSKYLEKGLDPVDLPDHFEEVKENIDEDFK